MIHTRRLAATVTALLAILIPGVARATSIGPPTGGLEPFKAWLEKEHPGYHCDRGPAWFLNRSVEAAYPRRRFAYVLSYTLGIPRPERNMLSLVAEVTGDGTMRPLRPWTAEVYGVGLIPVRSAADARRAAAGVMVLAMGDPAEGRNHVEERLVTARRRRGAWLCTFSHGANYVSEVRFDRQGRLADFRVNTPPVP
jgi:hypothetical protein